MLFSVMVKNEVRMMTEIKNEKYLQIFFLLLLLVSNEYFKEKDNAFQVLNARNFFT
jgi:hypothetical protein